MNPQFLIAAVIAAIGFGGGWQIQSWRYAAKEQEREQQILANVRDSAAADIRRLDNAITASNLANTRGVVLARNLDRARTELERLRVTVATTTVPSTCDAPGPGPDRAATGGELLLECAAALTELGGKADRHASDLRTMMDAWPK